MRQSFDRVGEERARAESWLNRWGTRSDAQHYVCHRSRSASVRLDRALAHLQRAAARAVYARDVERLRDVLREMAKRKYPSKNLVRRETGNARRET